MTQRDFIGEINKLKERVGAWKWEAGRFKKKWLIADAAFKGLSEDYEKVFRLLWFTLAAFVLQIFEILLWIWWIL